MTRTCVTKVVEANVTSNARERFVSGSRAAALFAILPAAVVPSAMNAPGFTRKHKALGRDELLPPTQRVCRWRQQQ